MIKKISLLSIVAMIAGVFAVIASTPVTPSKNKKTQSYALSNFNEIKAERMINIEYEQTDNNTWSVELTAPENIMPYIRVFRKGGCLVLTVDNGLSSTRDVEIKAKVKAPYVKEVKLSGASSFKSGKINLAGQQLELDGGGASVFEIKGIVASSLEIDINGATTVNVGNTQSDMIEVEASGASVVGLKNIKARNIEVEGSGASCIELSGKTDYAEYKVTGASELTAGSLSVSNGKVKATGASNAKVRINNILMQQSSGASTIKNEK